MLARTGGEEFVTVFSDTDLEECREVLERLRALMPDGETCSAGIARFQRGDSRETLVHRADRALYVAKDGGRDRAGTQRVGSFPERSCSSSRSMPRTWLPRQ